LRCVNVRLVDGNVFVHEITERFNHLFRKGKKNCEKLAKELNEELKK
jgi:hypothetical protein